jgi:hypothetical protein
LSNYLRQVITLADYIYHKNEIGKPPRKEFALIEKRYHNIFLTPDTYEVIAYNKGGVMSRFR